ncbi:helix-turn-helix domain-containing protein [Fictibacillus barbaricus]|uniref:Transcriptional regulator with XRE-family HTH domain n=1 Tax=Fictibacillus barbaricus TaxID=182136 RepID=A0ABU1U5Q5_9BACL|nr:helix-turn-helix transcriptional regulator [Fictibacillus barbaricus]MDR7074728.1 transcriptional regulator with XRE-family HTH domain [Fictibacillus barbaricus]
MTFGQRLKELREKAGLSAEEFAKKVEFTKSLIWSYENDKKEPGIGHLIRIANFYNISIDYLVYSDKKIPINLQELNHNYTFYIDSKELTLEELKESIVYIKLKRIMEIENKVI